jgi:hypothetical protein
LPRGLDVLVADAVPLSRSEDPEAAVVRLRVRPRAPAEEGWVIASADGFQSTGASFPWGEPGRTATATLSLERTAALVALLRFPPGAGFVAQVQAPKTEGAGWDAHGYTLPTFTTPGEHRAEGLRAGRYRVQELRTGLVTPEVVLGPGATARATLDLSDAYVVAGRVRVPKGWDPRQATVVLEASGVDPGSEYGRGRVVRADGGFSLHVPGDRPVTLRVAHPELAADPKAGVVVVTGARTDVDLALVEGTVAVARLLLPEGASTADLDRGWVLVSGDAAGRGSSHHVLRRVADGRWRFAGHEPGTRDVTLVLDDVPPKVLRGVSLPAGRVDLGDVAFERGSTLVVRLATRDGSPPPEVGGTLEAVGDVEYERDLVRDGAVLRARGLGAGTFRARFRWETPDGREREVERDVTADGRTDVAIDLDVR